MINISINIEKWVDELNKNKEYKEISSDSKIKKKDRDFLKIKEIKWVQEKNI